MDMTGEQRIPAPRPVVWDALLDPEVLKACIPGCEKVTKTSDTEYTADVVAKVGPVKAKFTGAVTLGDLDPPNSCTISGEGKGGPAGFAKGSAKVALADAPEGGTLLTYTVAANVGGKLAQIGSRLIDGVARKMADDFFSTFNEIAAQRAPAPAPATAAAAPAPTAAPPPTPEPTPASTSAPPPMSPGAAAKSGGLPTWVWVLGLIVIVVAGLIFFGR
jgi:carbon monoxide dehydrogenase subunit G